MDHMVFGEALWNNVCDVFPEEMIASIPGGLDNTHQKLRWLFKMAPWAISYDLGHHLTHYIKMNWVDWDKNPGWGKFDGDVTPIKYEDWKKMKGE